MLTLVLVGWVQLGGSLLDSHMWLRLYPKFSLCTSVLNWILETEFWVKEKRTALLLCQAKGVTEDLMPSRLCVPTWSQWGWTSNVASSLTCLMPQLGWREQSGRLAEHLCLHTVSPCWAFSQHLSVQVVGLTWPLASPELVFQETKASYDPASLLLHPIAHYTQPSSMWEETEAGGRWAPS